VQEILFLDDSKYSTKVSRSKVFNAVKAQIEVVYRDNPTISPVQFDIHAYPTLLSQGSRYVGVKAILNELERLNLQTPKKPLF